MLFAFITAWAVIGVTRGLSRVSVSGAQTTKTVTTTSHKQPVTSSALVKHSHLQSFHPGHHIHSHTHPHHIHCSTRFGCLGVEAHHPVGFILSAGLDGKSFSFFFFNANIWLCTVLMVCVLYNVCLKETMFCIFIMDFLSNNCFYHVFIAPSFYFLGVLFKWHWGVVRVSLLWG